MGKRIILSLVGIIVVAIIAAGIAIALLWSRLPGIISSKLSEKMGVNVAIGDMRFGWNDIDIHNVEVGNPRGYFLPKAFTAKIISMFTPLPNYLDNPIVIDRIEINNVYVGIELDSKGSKKGNWTAILGNLQANQSTGKGKSVLIKKLILTNIDIDLAYTKEHQVNHLDRIKKLEFDNVSSEKGIPYEQISSIIFNQMLKKIFTIENITDMLQNFIPQGTPGGDALQLFKGVFGSELEEEYQLQD
jgi:uncharacterized protein involved in outer membrane biogenesis